MKHLGEKIVVGTLATVITFSSLNIDAMAAGNVSSVLPTNVAGTSGLKSVLLESITGTLGTSKPIEATILPENLSAETLTTMPAEPTEEELYKDLVIAQVNDYVNVRSIPSQDGEILGKLYDDSVGNFISEENGWYQITSGSVTGYVKAEYCVTGEAAVELAKEVGTRFATVDTQTLYVRMEPTTDSKVLAMVPGGEDFVVIEETEDWAKITMEEYEGWVSKEYVVMRTEFVQAESKEEEEIRLAKEAEARRQAQEAARASQAAQQTTQQTTTTQSTSNYAVGEGSELGVAVAEYALQFVGNPYKWGGTSLTNGADCSGFVMSVYANFGVSLPHSSKADRTQGYAIDGLENAQPGDLICYSGHVALYIGNGQIVHAANAKSGIIVSNADYKKILAIRRIF